MKRQLIPFFFILLFICCKKQTTILFTPIKNFKLDFKTNESRGIDYCNMYNNTYITYVDAARKKIGFVNINTGKIEDSIPLLNLDSIEKIEQGINYFIHNPDSVFVILKDINKIYLLTHSGEIKKCWTVDMPNRTFVSLPQDPLYFKNNQIYLMGIRTDLVLRSPQARNAYFLSAPDLCLTIEKDNIYISDTSGNWPAVYRQGFSYYDFWPSRCINNAGELIYSFSVNDSLYIYENGKLKKTVNAKSKYFENPVPYPDDGLDNFGFIRKYWVTQSRYAQLIYDPYRNYYYRIVKHAKEYENTDGTVNEPRQKDWSILILNDQFEKLDEINFDAKLYNPYIVAPVSDGILIAKQLTADDKTYRSFVLFNIK